MILLMSVYLCMVTEKESAGFKILGLQDRLSNRVGYSFWWHLLCVILLYSWNFTLLQSWLHHAWLYGMLVSDWVCEDLNQAKRRDVVTCSSQYNFEPFSFTFLFIASHLYMCWALCFLVMYISVSVLFLKDCCSSFSLLQGLETRSELSSFLFP